MIPLVDLKAQYLAHKAVIDQAIKEVIEDSAFIGGEYLHRFERAFASYCHSRHCIGTSNGTSSIYCALKAMGLKYGDEVITAANTFIATTEAISLAGGRIKLVDVEDKTLNIDVDKLKEAITPRTRAIIPVHLYGQPSDMDPIYELAEEKDLFVIEDAAQAHGASYKGQKIGSRGTVSFSFFPAKILGGFGDGGAIVTDDEELAHKIRLEVDHGRVSKYEHIKEGFNFRLDSLQANILNAKLPFLDAWVKRRRELAACYNNSLKGVRLPEEAGFAEHSYYMYVIRCRARESLIKLLTMKGISTGIHYPIPLHKQPAYSYMSSYSYPVSEDASTQILSIPLYPELTESQQTSIIEAINSFSKR